MDCRDVRPLLSASMDNELTPDELRQMREHVQDCAECAATLAGYRQLRSAIRSLPQPVPPPNLRTTVFAKATPAYRRRAFLFDLGQQGLAAGALVAVIVAVLFTGSLVRGAIPTSPGRNEPPRITRTEPSDVAPAWNLTVPVRITFSKQMDQASVEEALRIEILGERSETIEENPADLIGRLAWENDGRTLVIGRGGGLRSETDYRITFADGVARDRDDNLLEADGRAVLLRTTSLVAIAPTPTASPVTPSPTASPTAPAATPSPDPTEAPASTPTSTATTTTLATATSVATATVAPPSPTVENVPAFGPAAVSPTATAVPSQPTPTKAVQSTPKPATAAVPTAATGPAPAAVPGTEAADTAPPTSTTPPTATPVPGAESTATPEPTATAEPTATPEPTVAPVSSTPSATATTLPTSTRTATRVVPTATPSAPAATPSAGQSATPVPSRTASPTIPGSVAPRLPVPMTSGSPTTPGSPTRTR